MRQLLLFDELILPVRCEKGEALTLLAGLRERGLIIGTDEAGRGALAGPVVAAAVCLTQEQEDSLISLGLKDSKRLSPKRREELFTAMKGLGVLWRAYMAGAETVDRDNVLNASLLAMNGAVSRVAETAGRAECVIVDGNARIKGLEIPQWVLVKADDIIPCVSAASVAAKVIRDRLMMRLSAKYPGYSLGRNKGYPTRAHMEAVRRNGLSDIHRVTFCRKILQERGEITDAAD
ncbi:MAG: ribonuclease HII [Synergistaceae bacterium]|nr:ribonuclease HII [Synergistaceae bacterium]